MLGVLVMCFLSLAISFGDSEMKNLLIIVLAIAMFPNFIKGVVYLKKDLRFLFCNITEACHSVPSWEQ